MIEVEYSTVYTDDIGLTTWQRLLLYIMHNCTNHFPWVLHHYKLQSVASIPFIDQSFNLHLFYE